MRLSVVVPAHNASATLPRCLGAVRRHAPAGSELIVVDDGSSDGTAEIAHRHGAVVVRHDTPGGPALARNRGVSMARAPVVLFVDADVEVADDALGRVLDAFDRDASLTAVFGSYDDDPAAGTLVSDYRNLLHHFVHQQASVESATFWAGLGAVRRDVLLDCGGFDERYVRPSIEDIELGARLAGAGHRIRLDKDLRGKHLKRWTLLGMARTDVLERARPWTRLLLRDGTLPRDLNLQWRHRASGVMAWLVVVPLPTAVGVPSLGWALAVTSVCALAALAVLNLDFYRYLAARRGMAFAIAAFPLHGLYYAYASGTFAWCCAEHVVDRLTGRRAPSAAES